MGLKRHNKRLKKVQQSLSRKKIGSNNFKKQKLKVAKEHQDLVNYRADFYHKASTEIVLNSDKIIMENLGIKNMMKNKKLAKHIGQQSWGQFMTMIEYKAKWYKKELVVLDRFFPSSKFCSKCHIYNKQVKQQDTWQCFNCLKFHQRDENAVKNMQNYELYQKQGKRYIYIGDNNNNNNIDENQVNKLNNKNKDNLTNNLSLNNHVLPSRQDQSNLLPKVCGEIVRL